MPTVEILKKRVGSKGNYTTIKVTSEIALDDSAEFKRIQERMDQLLDEELAKDDPSSFFQIDPAHLPQPQHQSQPQSRQSDSNVKLASEKQVRCLKAMIREHRLSESEICLENHVENIEDLPSKTCWKLINDLKNEG